MSNLSVMSAEITQQVEVVIHKVTHYNDRISPDIWETQNWRSYRERLEELFAVQMLVTQHTV